MDILNTAKSNIRRFTDTLTGVIVPQSVTSPNWHAIITSVRGFSHIRTNLPNQDAIKCLPETGIGNRIILSIADGHGSKKYFRSDVGSQLAVETACEVCRNFLNDYSGKESIEIKNLKFRDIICREIVRKWREKVNVHILNNPFTPDEEALIPKKHDDQKNSGVEKIRYRPSEGPEEQSIIPYGTTVISVVVTEKFILYLQLGDGDILTVLPDGSVSRPLPKDDRLIANETTSLCLPVAWDEFRVRYYPADSLFPVMIMVSSDGYSTSFEVVNDFEKVGPDILNMIIEDPGNIDKGIDLVNENLEKWLNETSEKGSGDDISVGFICNLDKMKKISKKQMVKKAENKKIPPETIPEPEKTDFPDNEEHKIDWVI